MDNDGIGLRIRSRRESLGLTQKELGENVGVGGTNIRAIETGRADPSYKVFLKLGNALNSSLDWLAYGKQKGQYYVDTSATYNKTRLIRLIADANDADVDILLATAEAMNARSKRGDLSESTS